MKKIDVLTDFLHDGRRFTEGEAVNVENALAEYFCRCGWANDPSGEYPTGKLEPGEVVVVPDKITIGQSAG